MKKANKKINKFIKLTLLTCMVFSQIASPIKVFASEVLTETNQDITITQDKNTDKLILQVNADSEKIELEKTYIVEIVKSFKYIDNNTYKDEATYNLALGSELINGMEIPLEKSSYNGVREVKVTIYDVTDDSITDLGTYTKEDYQTLLASDSVSLIMNSSFTEIIVDNENSVTLEVVGDSVTYNEETGIYEITQNDINNIVTVKNSILPGNLNPYEEYHTVLKVNGMVADIITEDLELDFSKLLSGTYELEYEVRDKNENVFISNKIVLNYTSTEVQDKVAFITEGEFSDELYYSYSTLTEEEKEMLGDDYRYLGNMLATLVDLNILSSASEVDSTMISNYNYYKDGNNYHIITSDNLKGAFNEESIAYKVKDIKDMISIDFPYTNYTILNKDGTIADNNEFIKNGMKLRVVILGEVLEYDFQVYGDVDGESYVDINDLKVLIDKLLTSNITLYDEMNLDMNGDEIINVNDLSVLGSDIYSKDYLNNDIEQQDIIKLIAESDRSELYVGEQLELYLSVDGLEYNSINTLEGFVNFDEEGLKLENIELLSENFVGNSLGNRFLYASDQMLAPNGIALVKLTFTALKEGNYSISFNGTNLYINGLALDTVNAEDVLVKVNRLLHTDASIKSLTSSVGSFDKAFNKDVLDYTLYVDSSVNKVTLNGELNDIYAKTTGFKEYYLTGDTTPIQIKVEAEDGSIRVYNINVVKIYHSSNNNLSNIEIEGYDIDFDKDTLEYKIDVDSSVTSLNINAIVEDNNAWAKIEGNENFKEGENIVTITVYAQNGETKTYKLVVNKAAEKPKTVTPIDDDDEEEESKSKEKVIIIILIILVVIGLLYLIFKKDDDDEEEIKIKEIKENKKTTDKNKNKK